MKVFYWTEPQFDNGVNFGPSFYQVDSEDNFAGQISISGVTKEAIIAMFEDGYTEISWRTALCLGLPI